MGRSESSSGAARVRGLIPDEGRGIPSAFIVFGVDFPASSLGKVGSVEPLVLPSLVVAAPDSGIAIDRDLPFAHPEGRALHANLFHPAGEPRGTVLLVHGEPALEEGGVFWGEDRRVKDTAPLESWSRLLAAGGLAAVSFNHRATAGFTAPEAVDRDLDALVAWLERRGLPVDRLGLLAFSGGTPFALRLARRDPRVRAVVTLYLSLIHI